MTDIQIKVLKSLCEDDKSAIELCKELSIEPSQNNEGGYYNALNECIRYHTSEISNKVEIYYGKDTPVDKSMYTINDSGREYIEEFMRKEKEKHRTYVIGITGIVVAAVAVVVSIIISYLK
ncbi:hypothetical protein CLPUN_09510 [Clostridium puniceum]|uniref:Uncharacterized protein n=1 Tax=Clostridium puniceum TaxID=29367 RepID=A0A1S8TVF1_9CLOT|nr:hypothetical protein [Clostridium puniceum]OOM81767.1 hypothetical protein CLPUN_09510 [Clostridium puniceum]